MRKLIKTINYYDDGSYEETNYFQAPEAPKDPWHNPWEIKPLNPWEIIPPNITDLYNNSCSKCGLKLESVMSYCCSQSMCPSGLGSVWSSTITTGSVISSNTVQWPGTQHSEGGL